MSGEGDLTKHLKYMGYQVTSEQQKIDEYEFGVRNIKIDLKDGIRLCKLVSLMMQQGQHHGQKEVMEQVRLHDSRLNKMFNVKLALKQLESKGIISIHDARVSRPHPFEISSPVPALAMVIAIAMLIL